MQLIPQQLLVSGRRSTTTKHVSLTPIPETGIKDGQRRGRAVQGFPGVRSRRLVIGRTVPGTSARISQTISHASVRRA